MSDLAIDIAEAIECDEHEHCVVVNERVEQLVREYAAAALTDFEVWVWEHKPDLGSIVKELRRRSEGIQKGEIGIEL